MKTIALMLAVGIGIIGVGCGTVATRTDASGVIQETIRIKPGLFRNGKAKFTSGATIESASGVKAPRDIGIDLEISPEVAVGALPVPVPAL